MGGRCPSGQSLWLPHAASTVDHVADLGPIALNEALRRVNEQMATLGSIRTAAGTILTASTIGSAFLAGIALDDGRDVGCLAWFAIVATVATGVLSLLTLLPLSVGVATSPALLDTDEWKVHTDNDAAMHLAKYVWNRAEKNVSRLGVRWWLIIGGCATTTVSLALWIAAIANRTPPPTGTP